MRAAPILFFALAAAPALARDVTTSPASDTSVTIYRAPWRNGGDITLQNLGGFAVVTETRRVELPAGESRVRFEGVAEGIIPESAIVRGLPGGVVEKNRDAALLSPSALLRAAVDGRVQLKRTDRATGKVRLIAASVESASEDGVILKTAEGYEALRCAGQPETVRFERAANGLSAVPTLSVVTRTARATTATVTLTYITENFDWSASYTARIAPDGETLDLGGWITLANGNSVSLLNAKAQIVAGGVYRAYVEKYVNAAPRVVANCWPLGKTSDIPLKPDRPYALVSPYLEPDYHKWSDQIIVTGQLRREGLMSAPIAVNAVSAEALAPPPPPEQLGDLKMYRVPQRTTVAAMQMKQTRLVEQHGVKFERLYRTWDSAQSWYSQAQPGAASIVLRTKNDKEHGLGLPLPAGSIVFEQDHAGRALLIGQPALLDKAEGEEIELDLGTAPAISVTRRTLQRGPGLAEPLLPAELLGWYRQDKQVYEFEIANAEPVAVPFELRLNLYGTQKVTRASHPHGEKDGDRLFRLTVPANDRLIVRYTLE